MQEPQGSVEGKIVDGFLIQERFASGGFSNVHFAKHILTNRLCAAKIMDLSQMNQKSFNGMMREISILMQVYHSNIVSFYRLSLVGKQLFLFMEFSPSGTLLEYTNKMHGLKENEARRIFMELFEVLRHLHMYYFLVHRDLKLENVLLDANRHVKLIDFGLSGTFFDNILKTFVGSPGYTPPEIVAGNEYGEKCDVWSLGVCLYAMLASKVPFSCQTKDVNKLIEEREKLKPPMNASAACWDLIKQMLTPRPTERCTLREIQGHPWLTGLPPIKAQIAPTPIVFYRVNGYEDIMKFKRKRFGEINQEALDEAARICQTEADALRKELELGLFTDATTTYFMLLDPIVEKPVVKEKLPPLIAGKEKRKKTSLAEQTRAKMFEADRRYVAMRRRSLGMKLNVCKK